MSKQVNLARSFHIIFSAVKKTGWYLVNDLEGLMAGLREDQRRAAVRCQGQKTKYWKDPEAEIPPTVNIRYSCKKEFPW